MNAARERERRRAAINRNFTYKKERVEAFTDGVIAIASTFIALELKVDDNADAGSWFVKHLDKILCMILTMFMLLNLWLIHHQIFSYLPEIIPSKLVLLNSLFCFSTTLIPLTTSFAFYFNEYKTAVALPCFVGLFASSLLAIIDWVGFRGQPTNGDRWLFVTSIRIMLSQCSVYVLMNTLYFTKVKRTEKHMQSSGCGCFFVVST